MASSSCGAPTELGEQVGQRLLCAGVDEHLLHPQERVVARRPGAAPIVRQLLVALEDLLGDDPGVAGRVGEPCEVGAGVGQPVGMVDPEAVDRAGGVLLEQEPVGVVEHVYISTRTAASVVTSKNRR